MQRKPSNITPELVYSALLQVTQSECTAGELAKKFKRNVPEHEGLNYDAEIDDDIDVDILISAMERGLLEKDHLLVFAKACARICHCDDPDRCPYRIEEEHLVSQHDSRCCKDKRCGNWNFGPHVHRGDTVVPWKLRPLQKSLIFQIITAPQKNSSIELERYSYARFSERQAQEEARKREDKIRIAQNSFDWKEWSARDKFAAEERAEFKEILAALKEAWKTQPEERIVRSKDALEREICQHTMLIRDQYISDEERARLMRYRSACQWHLAQKTVVMPEKKKSRTLVIGQKK